MAAFSITEAAWTGPRLMMRQPLAVAAWGLIPAVAFALILLVFGGSILALIGRLAHMGDTSSMAVEAIVSLVAGLLLLILVVALVSWVVGAVTTAAVIRAVLHPEQSAYAYLRFGREELLLMLLSAATFLVFVGVGTALAIPSGIITVAFAGSSTTAQLVATAVLGFVRYAVTIWIWLRLSMSMPMTFADRQFRLFESWALTRGHTLPIFLAMVLAVLVLMAVELAASVPALAGLFLAMNAWNGAFQGDPQVWAAHPQAVLAAFWPTLVIWCLLYGVVAGVSLAVMRGPLAHIYRVLAGTDVAATFT